MVAKRIFYIVSLQLIISQSHAQSSDLKIPNRCLLPINFQRTIKERETEFMRLFHNDSTSKSLTTAFILEKIDNDSNYNYLFLAEYWIAFHYREIIPELIKRLTIKREVGLVNSADLRIWERIQNQQMELYDHGANCDDDLFTVAGRANRLLIVITGENLGHVSMYSTENQLEELKNSWIKWLKALNVD